MDRSDLCQLPTVTYTVDAIGQRIEAVTWGDRYCSVDSITQSEYAAAGSIGLKPEYKITIFEGDYNGEEMLKYNNVVYSIYRTYRRKDDCIELYVQKKTGA